MKSLVHRLSHSSSLSSATLLITGSGIVSLLLGVVRTGLINESFNNFSASAYFVAFKVPELVLYICAAGALSVAFIPVLADKIYGRKSDTSELTSSLLNIVALTMGFLSVLLLILAPWLLANLVAPGLSPEGIDLATVIMRLAALNTFLFSIGYILASFQQAHHRFIFFAMGPVVYNLAMILSIYLFRNSLGVVGLGVGAVAGGLFSLLIMSIGMSGLKFKYKPLISFKDKATWQVLRAIPARSLDAGVIYFNALIQVRYASYLSVGAVTNLENAFIFYNAPITLVGVAIGVASFPQLTKRLSQKKQDLFRKDFLRILKSTIWLAIPVVVFSYLGKDFLAQIVFVRDGQEIAFIFGLLALGILSRTIYVILVRFFYAHKNTVTPLLLTLVVMALNIILLKWLAQPETLGLAGLPITISLLAVFEILILALLVARQDRGLFNRRFAQDLLLFLIIGALSLTAGFWYLSIFGSFQETTRLILALKLTGLATVISIFYGGLSKLLGVKEVALITRLWRKR